MIIREIARKAGKVVPECPICGCNKLWLKHITARIVETHETEVGVLYKCDKCAYVNTSEYIKVIVPYIVNTMDYVDFFDEPKLIDLNGNIYPYTGYRYIGREFWSVPDIQKPDGIHCKCGADLEIQSINPFYRTKFVDDQYRCDIICRCKNGHNIAFGVHISREDYEELIVRLSRR